MTVFRSDFEDIGRFGKKLGGFWLFKMDLERDSGGVLARSPERIDAAEDSSYDERPDSPGAPGGIYSEEESSREEEKREYDPDVFDPDVIPPPIETKSGRPFATNPLPPVECIDDNELHPYIVKPGFEQLDMFPIAPIGRERVKEAVEFCTRLTDKLPGSMSWCKNPTVSVKTIRTLFQQDEWQTDEMITYIIKHHQQLFNLPPTDDKSVFFNGFFTEELLQWYLKVASYYGIRFDIMEKMDVWFGRKMKGKRIKQCDSLIFLINPLGCHWALVVLFPKYHRFEVIDSMGQNYIEYVRALWLFLDYRLQVESRSYVASDWKVYYGRPCIPLQEDSNSCGFFAVFFAIFIKHQQQE